MSCNSDELKGLIHDSDESSAKIAELKAYVDDELKNTKNWGSATFATLEQYQSLYDEVATLKEGLSALDSSLTSKINSSISSLESSMKTWVNGQLANYYTIAEMNAKLEALQNAITGGDSANAEEIATLIQSLETAKSDLTEAYHFHPQSFKTTIISKMFLTILGNVTDFSLFCTECITFPKRNLSHYGCVIVQLFFIFAP